MSLTVEDHYRYGDLADRIQTALTAAGLGEGRLNWSNLAPLDQFHIRGLAATVELGAELAPTSEHKLLDVGSGLGGPSRYLQATFGCEVTGIDLSESYIHVSNLLADRTGQSEHLRYIQGNALDLPMEDERFDIVMTQHVAMNIAGRPKLYSEMYRVLKPGGRLAIYDVVAGNGDPLTFPVPWARTPEISHLLTADETRSVLESAGFAEQSWSDKTEEGIRWFEEILAARRTQTEKPTLGLQVVMGPEFAGMAANLAHALRDGRAAVVQSIFSKAERNAVAALRSGPTSG